MVAAVLDDTLTTFDFDNPYPTYQRLREEDPVHWARPWEQWLITRYDDVIAVLQQPDRFGSGGWEQHLLQRLPAEVREQVPTLVEYFTPDSFLSIADPPAHARMRRPVVRALTPRAIAQVEPMIARAVDSLLDDAARAGRFDAVRDFAHPLPAIVITEMMGLPSVDRGQFLEWSADIVDFLSTGTPSVDRAIHAEASTVAIKAYLGAAVDRRRVALDDGLISLLVESSTRPDSKHLPFSNDELVATTVEVLVGGHETTTNLIGNGLLALLRHPDQFAALRANPSLATSAVEELLRYDAPIQRVRRITRVDTELRGRRIHRGQLVMAMAGSANRDPEVFPNPDRLDIERTPNPHLAFGYGIHFCPGQALSRLEARIVFERLPSRFPNLGFVDGSPPTWRPNVAFRGLDRFPVRID